jgi:flagellar basal-body rod protein FlgG
MHRPGQTRQTGRSLDVAIVGPGFFRVRRPDGRIAYTRAGNFCLSPDRRLVTVDGRSEVLDEGNAPIRLDDTEVHIGRDGAITTDEAFLGRLGLVRFRDPAKLEKVGDNLFLAGAWAEDGAEIQTAAVEVVQGQLELSGASAVQSMVEMIEVLRAYEANMGFVRIQDQTLARAVADLGRLA